MRTTVKSVVLVMIVWATVSTAYAGAADTPRVLPFPADRCVGTIAVQDDTLQREVKGFHYWADGAEWEYFGPAFGEVTIPAGKRVSLILREAGWKDLSFLSAFGPDDIHSLAMSPGYSPGGGSRPTDACMAHLAHLTGLRTVNLQGTAVTTRGMMSLRGMTQLERIYLPAGASNSTMKLLHVFGSLKALYIGQTNIQDLGLTQFEGMDRLEELELGGKQFTNDGLKSLRHLKSVRYLVIWGPLSDEGFAYVAQMPNLRTININTEQFGDRGLEALSRMPTLEAISARDKKEITDRGVNYLAGMRNLRKLDIAGSSITPRSLQTLGQIATLEQLDLGGTQYTDAQVAPLGALKNLRSLWVSASTASPLTDKTLMMLRGLPLESLTIGGEFTDDGFGIVGGMRGLKQLCIAPAPHFNNKITDAGLAHLDGLKNLEMLTLGNIRNCTLSGLNALRLPKLKNIHIDDLQQDNKGLDLSGMPAMEDMIVMTRGRREGDKLIVDPYTDDDLKSFANLKKLRRIQVAHTGLSDRGLTYLSGLENAEFINLGGDGITDEGLAAIAHLPKLNRLIIDGHITDAGLRQLENARALSWLEIRSPQPISQMAVQQLKNKLPYLVDVKIN